MRATFLLKDNKDNVVYYIDVNHMRTASGKLRVHGPSFSATLAVDDIDSDNITSILTKEDFELLVDTDDPSVIAKLQSKDNEALFEQVQKEEAEYLIDEYGLDENEVAYIFEVSSDITRGYKDRDVVVAIFQNAKDLGYETMLSWDYMNRFNRDVMERFFDFEGFGEELWETCDEYVKLSDGRIIEINY